MTAAPTQVDGHHVRAGCDVADIADIQHSLTVFGDRYLHKVFTTAQH
jgi:holo-[acyl-carrier protein] synthase